jgi:hypothetical protein
MTTNSSTLTYGYYTIQRAYTVKGIGFKVTNIYDTYSMIYFEVLFPVIVAAYKKKRGFSVQQSLKSVDVLFIVFIYF